MADQTCACVSISTPDNCGDDRNYCLRSLKRPTDRVAPHADMQGADRVATIYKICEQASWRAAEPAGRYRGSAVDERDGFIHFSTAAQVAETAAKHFAGQTDLVLVAVDGDALGPALKWERSRGGDLFPHLYARVAAFGGALGAAAARSRPTAGTRFRSLNRDRPVRPSRPAAFCTRSIRKTPTGSRSGC